MRRAAGSVATDPAAPRLSDRRLGEVVAAATPLGSGIGGRTAELKVGGTRVFVKRVPLTDIELRNHLPDSVRGNVEHETFLRDWIAGDSSEGAPPAIAAIIDRHARAAMVLDAFHHRLLTASKRTPYPAAGIERARPGGRSAT
ncbi:hypothetical protein [Streptomyces sp. NPDC088400]|uniref:hypothetical protein n=1 Tax=Streptomyces sp. NPDC088400 TaxID=3365861 RepID=UPI0037FACBDF